MTQLHLHSRLLPHMLHVAQSRINIFNKTTTTTRRAESDLVNGWVELRHQLQTTSVRRQTQRNEQRSHNLMECIWLHKVRSDFIAFGINKMMRTLYADSNLPLSIRLLSEKKGDGNMTLVNPSNYAQVQNII